jgi:hypothetical protein
MSLKYVSEIKKMFKSLFLSRCDTAKTYTPSLAVLQEIIESFQFYVTSGLLKNTTSLISHLCCFFELPPPRGPLSFYCGDHVHPPYAPHALEKCGDQTYSPHSPLDVEKCGEQVHPPHDGLVLQERWGQGSL